MAISPFFACSQEWMGGKCVSNRISTTLQRTDVPSPLLNTPPGIDGMIFDHPQELESLQVRRQEATDRPAESRLFGHGLSSKSSYPRIHKCKRESIGYLWGVTLLLDITRGAHHGFT